MRSFSKNEVYAEFDYNTDYWSVFCDETGFCLGQFNSEEEAVDFINTGN